MAMREVYTGQSAESDSDVALIGEPRAQKPGCRGSKLAGAAALFFLAFGAVLLVLSRRSVSSSTWAESRVVSAWQAIPASRCAARYENCNVTKCCQTPGTQCYQKDSEYAMCWPDCVPGPRPTDSNPRPWTCKKLGPPTWGVAPRKYIHEESKPWIYEHCTGAGKDCGKTACCRDAGMACFMQNKSMATCAHSCPPGKYDCKQLGERTPGHTENDFTDIPKTRCADKFENCNTTKCCRTPGTQCFAKDDKYAMCWPECTPGRNPVDKTAKPWSCEKLGPRAPGQAPGSYWQEKARPWVAKLCAKEHEDCSRQGCCRDPGLACYRKDDRYSGCMADCVAGGPQPAGLNHLPWNCTQLGGRTPGTAKWAVPADWVVKKCSTPNENCVDSKCCKDPGFQCIRKNASFARCLLGGCHTGAPLLGDPDGPDPWNCSALGVRTPGPPQRAMDWPSSAKDLPSLFCWLVSQTVGGESINRKVGWMEETLVWQMYLRKIGLFACNEFAVFTDVKVIISERGGWGWPSVPENYTPKDGQILSWALGTTQSGKNGDTSPSNTLVFVKAWKALMGSGRLEKHNFVVKQDPDAVFIPWRVRWHANQWPSKTGSVPFFVKNCPGFGSMQGPLEIFSIAMVRAFLPTIDSCGGGSPGEDSKLEKCARQFGQPVMDGASLDDKYCTHDEPNCWDGNKIAFHPFKDDKLFGQCYESSMQIERKGR